MRAVYATVIATIYDSRAIDSEEGSGRQRTLFFFSHFVYIGVTRILNYAQEQSQMSN